MAQNSDPPAAPAAPARDPGQPRVRIRERSRPVREDEILPAPPPHLEFVFAERSLLPGEEVERYDTLQRAIVRQVTPADVIEAFWVKDIVDLIWETGRYRRWRNQIITQARREAAVACLLPLLQIDDDHGLTPSHEREARLTRLAADWLKGDERRMQEMERQLARLGLTLDDVNARAFQSRIAEVERVERMIASADQRRDGLLREVERKRAALGGRLREAAAAVIDAEPSTPLARPAQQPAPR